MRANAATAFIARLIFVLSLAYQPAFAKSPHCPPNASLLSIGLTAGYILLVASLFAGVIILTIIPLVQYPWQPALNAERVAPYIQYGTVPPYSRRKDRLAKSIRIANAFFNLRKDRCRRIEDMAWYGPGVPKLIAKLLAVKVSAVMLVVCMILLGIAIQSWFLCVDAMEHDQIYRFLWVLYGILGVFGLVSTTITGFVLAGMTKARVLLDEIETIKIKTRMVSEE